ncbi:Flp pilus assembly protein CpaB [Pectobacterium parmentieri]|uniref:Flp pilus assembly protein CpaB n=1 Tax=Pectobacterium parmentieri TaxID=1905730 RepID=UPI0001B0C800|nr:Flp pilus assembly protein CpaB [Pectobacterium parmentieri]ACX86712.1 Flp pilus assembly protein CpaB [Pectobacterium parmentieri WPP163]AYH04654.1 Flp pilus assembly protein CpaB [Pectobacterium parmentieri]AYH13476.1 Flp pilus assembly protein CpaB [Pectobacterium parmentieri]AYH22178.1 Flp pilus assembly protein CpaB [Pectobacterium parmentieri]MBI0550461.1 Flp pilus assembly protein CpaB [Pectobacterium parmentieri]
MKVNSTYVLSGALVLAGIVALVVRSHLSSAPPPPPPVVVQAPEKTAVLVAAKDLHPGDFIDSASLRWQVTEEPVSRTFNFVRGKDSQSLLFGATLRETVTEGSALTNNVLVRQNEPGFLAAVLGKGKRAISVPTSAVASNAGLVAAGDRVDVILSMKRDDQPELPASRNQPVVMPLLASQTIVRDLRVLALNDRTGTPVYPRLDAMEDGATLDAAAKSRESAVRSRPATYQTVTLEVTPQQAEALAVAKELGILHLALRSATPDDGIDPLTGRPLVTTVPQATDIYGALSAGSHKVKVYRGEQKDVVAFPAR